MFLKVFKHLRFLRLLRLWAHEVKFLGKKDKRQNSLIDLSPCTQLARPFIYSNESWLCVHVCVCLLGFVLGFVFGFFNWVGCFTESLGKEENYEEFGL